MSPTSSVILTIHVDTTAWDRAAAATQDAFLRVHAKARRIRAGAAYLGASVCVLLEETDEQRNARITDARDTYATAIDAEEAFR